MAPCRVNGTQKLRNCQWLEELAPSRCWNPSVIHCTKNAERFEDGQLYKFGNNDDKSASDHSYPGYAEEIPIFPDIMGIGCGIFAKIDFALANEDGEHAECCSQETIEHLGSSIID